MTMKDTYMCIARMIVWCFGRYLCSRGRNKIAKVDRNEIFFDAYKAGPDKVMCYFEFISGEDKTTSHILISPAIETPAHSKHNDHNTLDIYLMFLYLVKFILPNNIAFFVSFKTKPKYKKSTRHYPPSAPIQTFALVRISSAK